MTVLGGMSQVAGFFLFSTLNISCHSCWPTTIIFDEIDTGVSGAIATRMAQMMKQMADGGRQVISITHLPQIASVADHHYRVFKRDDNNDTTSQIEELDEEQRVNELAHMLSGTELTEAAIQNARELLRSK